MKKHHFENKESNLHFYAKVVLRNWIRSHPDRFGITDLQSVRIEEQFCEGGFVIFKPDLSVYDSNGLIQIYEVCHKSPLTGEKLNRMQFYFFCSNQNPMIYEIEAEYIMRQIKVPDKIRLISYQLFNDNLLF